MTDHKRVAYIDLAKGIGMVLVLCGHLQNGIVFSFSPYLQDFCRWIFSFHMPMFFIISGMLFAAKGEIPEMKVFFKKRFSSIMIPYYLFSVIYFLIIIYGVFVSRSMGISDMFVQLWYAVCHYGINVLWFLPALFFAEMIFAFIMKKFGGKKRWTVMILFTIAALCINAARRFMPADAAVWLRIDELMVTLIRPVIACSFISIGYLAARGTGCGTGDVSVSRFSQKAGIDMTGTKAGHRNVPCPNSLASCIVL
jgi:fucose 4-O-acetylase-like acetyltransferase